MQIYGSKIYKGMQISDRKNREVLLMLNRKTYKKKQNVNKRG